MTTHLKRKRSQICVKRHRRKGSLAVACRVYEKTGVHSPSGPVQASEVAAAGWTSLSVLTEEDCAVPLRWSARHGAGEAMWDGFPSVLLPIKELRLAVGVSENQAKEDFILWGLTMGIVNDFLTTVGLRQGPITLRQSSGRSKL